MGSHLVFLSHLFLSHPLSFSFFFFLIFSSSLFSLFPLINTYQHDEEQETIFLPLFAVFLPFLDLPCEPSFLYKMRCVRFEAILIVLKYLLFNEFSRRRRRTTTTTTATTLPPSLEPNTIVSSLIGSKVI